MNRFGRKAAAVALILALWNGGCGGGGESERAAVRGDRSGAESRFARNDLNLVLISIDTCRPDRIGCYGNDSIETPVIDNLAGEGTRFDRAVASAPLTLPSHATFMTSQQPYRHRVRNNGSYRLSEEKTTLAELLQEEGYETAAVLGAFPLDSRFGLNQGFDHYDDRFPPKQVTDIHDVTERIAEDVVNRAIEWMSGNKKKKSFLFVHFFDPHWRYEPPEPFAGEYKGSLYDGEIAYVDSEIGRLLEALDQFGTLENSVIALVGDHGEALGEHGEETHGIFVYGSTINIPLIIHWPDRAEFEEGGLRRGSVVPSLVRGIDLAPTLLELLGLRSLEDAEGTSLVPLMIEPDRSLELVNYSETFSPREDYGWSEVRSVANDEWKYILLPAEELYRPADDPSEENNLISRHPEKAAELRTLLEEWMTEDRARAGEDESLEIDEESREKLEALGYVTARRRSGADGGDDGKRADPKDRIEALNRFYAARTMQGKGRLEEALAEYRDLEKADPRNPEMLKAMAETSIGLGRLDEAEEIIQRAFAEIPNDLHLTAITASLHLTRKEYDSAIGLLESVLARDPKFEGGHLRLGGLYLLLKNYDRAIEEYQRELEIYPQSPTAYNGLGKVYKTMGRDEEAIKYYRKAIECRVDFAEAYYNLANSYNEMGNLEQAIIHYRRTIDYDPKMVEAYYNFALLAKAIGKRQESFVLLQKSVEQKPTFAKGHYGIGNYYREAGMLAQAIGSYETARKITPEDPDILLNYGVALAGMNRFEEAILIWDTAGRVAPQSASGQSAMENARLARREIGVKQ